MPDREQNSKSRSEERLERVADNPGARTAATNSDPNISLEEARNAAEGEGPNAMSSSAPNPEEMDVPSTSNPEATNIPSSNTPRPNANIEE